MLECPFAMGVCDDDHKGMLTIPIIPANNKELILSWYKKYIETFERKPLLKRVWKSLLYFRMWKLCSERNSRIF